jgi:hypothetical protein
MGETRAPVDLLVVDRPGVSSGCACSATDPALPRFAGDLEWLRWQAVTGRRLDPRVTGKELGGDADALAAVAAHGFDALPLILAGGAVRHAGSYPDRERLAEIVAAARGASQPLGAQ